MTSPRVFLPEAFRQRMKPEEVAKLEAEGVALDPLERLANYKLTAPEAGEVVVTTLQADEVEMFCRWKDAAERLERLERDVVARRLDKQAKDLRDGKQIDPYGTDHDMTKAEITELASLDETGKAYKTMMLVLIRTRVPDLWHYMVGIREGGRVTRTEQRRTAVGIDE